LSIYDRILLISFVLVPIVCGQVIPTDRLEHARAVNLQRLAGLPNFAADDPTPILKSCDTWTRLKRRSPGEAPAVPGSRSA
jgi:hypothetical protein